jgi:hypothetical protein
MNRVTLAIGELRAALSAGEPIMSVHYACESFYEIPDRPVGISCISFADLGSSSEVTLPLIDRKGEEREQDMLRRFYDFLRSHPDTRLVHWNMNKPDFGFLAIENRYRFLLDVTPEFKPSSHLMYDLDDLLEAVFGKDYADPPPRLLTMGALNGFKRRFMLKGDEEAKAYAEGRHADVRRSTSEKARLIAFLLKRFLGNTLLTNNAGMGFAGTVVDPVEVLACIADRFKDIARQLRRRYGNRPTLSLDDEHDAQDLFRALLKLFFEDVREEDPVPRHAGGASRIDFVLPDHAIAIELKQGRESLSGSTLGEELIVDIERTKAIAM